MKDVSYKEHWAFKETLELGYDFSIINIDGATEVTIYFDNGEPYAKFKLIEYNFEKYIKNSKGYYIYLVDEDGDEEFINNSIDFYSTYNEAIASCFYYFRDRF